MPDAVAAVALGVAVIAAIIGLSFYRADIWQALNEKTPHRNYPDGGAGPDGGGPTFGGDAGGGDGGSA